MKTFSCHHLSLFLFIHGQKFRIVRKFDIQYVYAVVVAKGMGLSREKSDIILFVPGDQGDAVAGQNHEKHKMNDEKWPSPEIGDFECRRQLSCHAAEDGVDKQQRAGQAYH